VFTLIFVANINPVNENKKYLFAGYELRGIGSKTYQTKKKYFLPNIFYLAGFLNHSYQLSIILKGYLSLLVMTASPSYWLVSSSM